MSQSRSTAPAGVDAPTYAAPETSAVIPTSVHVALEAVAARRARVEVASKILAEAVYSDLRLVAPLRVLLDTAYEEQRLPMEAYRQLKNELHRLVTEELPTDAGILAASSRAKSQPAPVAERAADITAGTVLRERFQLEECVAQGPQSDVYRASDLLRLEAGSTGTALAIKVLHDGQGADPALRQRLQRQAIVAQSLTHPNIARVHDLDRHGDVSFITMEWLQGESLAAHLDRIHPAPVQIKLQRQIIAALGSALAYAHGRDVVHGDVKPANVFLTDAGEIKLIDFSGVPKEGAAGDLDQMITPEYASCERLSGGRATVSDDLFSFACLIYRLACGRRPYGQFNALDAEARDEPLSRAPGLDDGQWALLRTALAFRRNDRKVSMAALVETLLRPPRVPEEPRAAKPKKPWGWLAVAAAGLVAAGIYFLLGSPGLDSLRSQDQSAVGRNDPVAPESPRAVSAGDGETSGTQPSSVNESSSADSASPVSVAIPGDSVSADATAVPGDPSMADSSSIGAGSAVDSDVMTDELPGSIGAASIAVEADGASRSPANPSAPGNDNSQISSPGPAAEGGGVDVSGERAGNKNLLPIAPTEPIPGAADVEADGPAVGVESVSAADAPRGGPLGFASDNYQVTESDGFIRLLVRAPAGHRGIRLKLQILGGSANAGKDFAPVGITDPFEIPAGDTRYEIFWPLVNDGLVEYVEDVELLLQSLTEAYPMRRPETLIVILDDDA